MNNDKSNAPAGASNDAGLANDLNRLEATAAGASDVPPEVAAMRQAQADQNVNNIQEWAALVEGLALPTFEILTPNWGVTAAECKLLGTAYAPVLHKYFPDGPTASPELTALLATIAIMGPRIGKPMRLPAEPEKKAA